MKLIIRGEKVRVLFIALTADAIEIRKAMAAGFEDSEASFHSERFLFVHTVVNKLRLNAR